MSVLNAAGARPVSVFGPEDEEDEHGLYQERTPLNSANNSPEGRKSVAARSGKAPSSPFVGRMSSSCSLGGVDAKSQITAKHTQHDMNLARNEAQAYAEENDARKSMTARITRIIFLFGPLIDAALLYVLGSDPLPQQAIDFGQNMRAIARAAQITAMCFTLFLGLYSLYVINAWYGDKPRFAAIASKQFRLLPEYKVISLVLDVGKLAYPSGLRVPLVGLLMVVRVVEFILVLRLTFLMRLATQLTDTKQLPEMLRTLLSLDGVDGHSLGDFQSPSEQRPLTVGLLETLTVFLAPRRLGHSKSEGAGLARNSALPLTLFIFIVTAAACFVDFNVLFSSQEPMIDSNTASTLAAASASETATRFDGGWRRPTERSGGGNNAPVTTVLLVVSGVTADVGQRILAPAFDRNVNPLCALDVTTRCDTFRLHSVTPSTSVPNWIASLTGTPPSVHGVLGNVPVGGTFPFDSVFGQASVQGAHSGISAAPWCVKP